MATQAERKAVRKAKTAARKAKTADKQRARQKELGEDWRPRGANAAQYVLGGVDWSQGTDWVAEDRAQAKAIWEWQQTPAGAAHKQALRDVFGEPEYLSVAERQAKNKTKAQLKKQNNERYVAAKKRIRQEQKGASVFSDPTSWKDENGETQWGSASEKLAGSKREQARKAYQDYAKENPLVAREMKRRAGIERVDYQMKREELDRNRRALDVIDRTRSNKDAPGIDRKTYTEEDAARYQEALQAGLDFRNNASGDNPYPTSWERTGGDLPDWVEGYKEQLQDPGFREWTESRPIDRGAMGYREQQTFATNPNFRGTFTYGKPKTQANRTGGGFHYNKELAAWEAEHGETYGGAEEAPQRAASVNAAAAPQMNDALPVGEPAATAGPTLSTPKEPARRAAAKRETRRLRQKDTNYSAGIRT